MLQLLIELTNASFFGLHEILLHVVGTRCLSVSNPILLDFSSALCLTSCLFLHF